MGIVDLTYVQIAVYDAVIAIDKSRTPFAVQLPNMPGWASPEAAIAAAAHAVLRSMFPAQTASLDTTLASYLATLPAGAARTVGVAVGSQVGALFMAMRAGDGWNATVPYTFRSGPGVYQLTPNCAATPANPVTPWLGQMRPFGVESPSQFRADGPPSLASPEWAEELGEVTRFGRSTASLRTADETEIGWFYAETPATWMSRNVANIAVAQQLTLVDSARYFAQVFVTISDALITAWNSKYHFNFWRPSTAILAADNDGNPGTTADPSWTPLVPTPCHPEYPAAHGAASGGLAYGLEQFFGRNALNITLTSTSVPGVALAEHRYQQTTQIAREAIDARIFGGMHYRTSGVHGADIARKVALYVATRYFQAVGSPRR